MALTLSKTNIATGNTIQAPDVSQSIDAFTGAVAYDITLSGSLQLTGSVKSRDGYTGSLFGNATTATTASFVTLAQTASFVTLAQTASFVTLAQTASFVTLAQTASFVTTAQTASFVALARSASYVALAVNDISTNNDVITWTIFNGLSYNWTINNVTQSISSSLAASAKRLTADNVRVRAGTNPPSTPYTIDQSTPAMVYLEFSGSNVGLELRQGTLGQMVTFNPYTTEDNIPTALVSITGSQASAFGYGTQSILFPGGNDTLDNLFTTPPVPNSFSFTLHYTSFGGPVGWYLVNVSKAS
jgi:hypothetical protein